METRRRIVGTAGHIDHGKTALVRALTGIDTDRLPEEKRRGITIDLGFAHWIAGEMQIGFIDVPGHERFVRNMLAGIGGIDAALLVVAADESIKPQTREHFDICQLLEIPTGLVAITKSDLVDEETVEIVRLEIEDLVRGSFLDGRPIVPVSSVTGAGVDALREAVVATLSETPDRAARDRVFRMPIDRAFTMKGFGSVVTGTTISGHVAVDDELEILPDAIRTRARGVQVHRGTRPEATAGERTSINLADVGLDRLRRGQHLVTPGTLRPSSIITASLHLLPNAPALKDLSRVRIHHYSDELLGKVRFAGNQTELAPGSSAWVQIHLEAPVVAAWGDRFVIRRYSPAVTIGGGVVLDPHLGKLRRGTRAEIFETLASADLGKRVTLLARLGGAAGITVAEIRSRTALRTDEIERRIGASALIRVGGPGEGTRLIHADTLQDVRRRAMEALEEFFRKNRTAVGMPKSELMQRLRLGRADAATVAFFFDDLAREKIAAMEGDLVHVPGRSRSLAGVEGELAREIESRFLQAGLMPPPVSELIKTIPQRPKVIEGVLGYLAKSGVVVRLAENVYLHRDVIEAAKAKLAGHGGQTVDVGWFKDLYGISRKVVIPLLEHFDRAGVTKRMGDRRQIV